MSKQLTQIFKHTSAESLKVEMDKWLAKKKPKIVAMSQSERRLENFSTEITLIVIYRKTYRRKRR